jgi:hypothetical protein
MPTIEDQVALEGRRSVCDVDEFDAQISCWAGEPYGKWHYHQTQAEKDSCLTSHCVCSNDEITDLDGAEISLDLYGHLCGCPSFSFPFQRTQS